MQAHYVDRPNTVPSHLQINTRCNPAQSITSEHRASVRAWPLHTDGHLQYTVTGGTTAWGILVAQGSQTCVSTCMVYMSYCINS